jgi:hypothetical protein
MDNRQITEDERMYAFRAVAYKDIQRMLDMVVAERLYHYVWRLYEIGDQWLLMPNNDMPMHGWWRIDDFVPQFNESQRAWAWRRIDLRVLTEPDDDAAD